MVSITSGGPEIMTKMGKSLSDVAYNINDEDDDDDDDEDVEAPDAPEGDEELARKVSEKENSTAGVRASKRLAKDQVLQQESQEGIVERERKQVELMTRRNEDRLREHPARERGAQEGRRRRRRLQASPQLCLACRAAPCSVAASTDESGSGAGAGAQVSGYLRRGQ